MYSPFPVRCPLAAPVPSALAYPKKMCSALGELQRREQRKETTAHDLALSYGRREVRRGKEQWWFLPAQLLGLRSLLSQPLVYLQLRHRTHGILLSRHPPSHIRGGEEVQHCTSAPLIRQEVPDPPPVLRPPCLLCSYPVRGAAAAPASSSAHQL